VGQERKVLAELTAACPESTVLAGLPSLHATTTALEPAEPLAQLDGLVIRLGAEAAPEHWEDTYGARCLCVVYDPVSRLCTMAGAGHPAPVLLRTDGTAHVLKVSPGPPLGVSGMPFESTTLAREPGSVLALYTDGLTARYDPDPDVAVRHPTARLTACCRPDRPLDDPGKALPAGAGGPHPAMTSPCSSPEPAACRPRPSPPGNTPPIPPSLPTSGRQPPPTGCLRAGGGRLHHRTRRQ
jgi:hypothetical protein